MDKVSIAAIVIVGVVLVVGLGLAAISLPELARYRRIRRM